LGVRASLRSRPNSLLVRANSLFAGRKFPVRSRREFGAKALNCLGNSRRKSSPEADIFEIPC
jgi:hypothetical protein